MEVARPGSHSSTSHGHGWSGNGDGAPGKPFVDRGVARAVVRWPRRSTPREKYKRRLAARRAASEVCAVVRQRVCGLAREEPRRRAVAGLRAVPRAGRDVDDCCYPGSKGTCDGSCPPSSLKGDGRCLESSSGLGCDARRRWCVGGSAGVARRWAFDRPGLGAAGRCPCRKRRVGALERQRRWPRSAARPCRCRGAARHLLLAFALAASLAPSSARSSAPRAHWKRSRPRTLAGAGGRPPGPPLN
jgi:hypothetical protein